MAALVASALTGSLVQSPLRPVANTIAFSSAFSTNANGAIVTLGNTLLTCPAGSSSAGVSCTNLTNPAYAGNVTADNNGFNMVNLDADGAGLGLGNLITTNSSSSDLNLPAGATVLWAGLYWGARLQAGVNGAAGNSAARGTMQFGVQHGAGQPIAYQAVSTDKEFGPNTASNNAYQEMAVVTDVIRANGNASYWGAGVAAATGQDRYAAWALSVVYSAPGLPLRNLTVFDGFNVVQQNQPQTITVSGFQAPLSGTVDAQLGMVAYEGDLSQTGDYTRLNDTQLATPQSPGSNFFDSSNEYNGAVVTTRNPAYRNMLGVDIINTGASGVIPNGATNARFTFSSNGDVYYPGVLTTAINLYAPDFTTSSKTVVNLNGNSPARPGDVLQYTLSYLNTGQDPSVQTVSTDPLPANTTFVPGSLQLLNGPGVASPVTLTDGSGDDVGEYDAAGRLVRVRLGSGASATAGGTLNVASPSNPLQNRSSYTFRVTLDDAAGGTTVTNLASLSYQTGTTHIDGTYTTSPVATDVANRADVSITKVMTPKPVAYGGIVTGTITVTNNGPNLATGVQMRDPELDGWTTLTLDPADDCRIEGTQILCDLGDLPSGTSRVVTVTGFFAEGAARPTSTNIAYASSTSFDPDLTNNAGSDTITMGAQADLAVTKTPASLTLTPGSTSVYTVTATNTGPSTAQSVTIGDLIPAGSTGVLSVVSATSTSPEVSCGGPAAAAVTCSVASLPTGASIAVQVTVRASPAATDGTTFQNSATVGSTTNDPNPANNSVTVAGTVGAPVHDVTIVKTGPASVNAGGTVTWTILVTNNGPSDATGVRVTDPHPTQVAFTNVGTSRGSCVQPAANVNCTIGALPAGSTATVTVTGTVAPDAAPGDDVLSNTASLVVNTVPSGSSTWLTDIVRAFDVSISKTANRVSLPAEAGLPVTYDITVTNNGPAVASGVSVRDLVPTALTYLSASTSEGSCDDDDVADTTAGDADHGVLTCTFGAPIPVGGTRTIAVHMTAPGDLTGGGDVTETVTVAAAGDTNSSNNSAGWTLSGEPQIDLSLTKSGPATVHAGDTGTYQLVVANRAATEGDDEIVAVAPVLVDTLPDGVDLVPSTTAGSQTPSSCDQSGRTVTCQLPDVAAGAATTVDLTVTFSPSLDNGASLVNSAEVIPDDSNTDVAPANNTATATTAVIAETDLELSGMQWRAYTGDPDFQTAMATPPGAVVTTAAAGSFVWLEWALTNHGPADAKGVQLLEDYDLPLANVARAAGAVVIWDDDTDSPLDADCGIVGTEFHCPAGTLAPGASVTVRVLMAVPDDAAAGATGSAWADASTTTPETDLANNHDEAPLTIAAGEVSLQVTKAPSAPVLVAGGTFGYTITVGQGARGGQPWSGLFWADAHDVTLTDTIPAGFHATAVSSSQGTCAIDPGDDRTFSCELGTVPGSYPTPAGSPATVTVTGTLDGDVEGEDIPNTAVVNTSSDNLGDTEATALVDVERQADLRLFKAVDAPVSYVGGQVGYTLTLVNSGPSAVLHGRIRDTLPVGLTLSPADSPGCHVESGTPETGQVVLCDRDGAEYQLASGQSVSVRVVTSTSPTDTPRDITNTATALLAAEDPNPANNTASVTSRLERLADVAITSNVSTTTPAAGGEITYSGFTQSNGPSAAWMVTGDTTFPPGFVPVSWDVPFNDCSWSPTAPVDPTSVAWSDTSYTLHCEPSDPSAPFSPGQSATSVVVMYIPGDTPTGGYDAVASIATQTPESTLANNTTSSTVYVQHVSDLTLTKTLVDPIPLLSGQPATWQLTVINHGPSTAENVVIADRVPDGMTYVEANIEGTACPSPEVDPDGHATVKCPLSGSLGVGGTATAEITFTVGGDTVGQEMCNSALVGSNSLDHHADDNEAEACSTVVASTADLSLVKLDAGPGSNPLPGAGFQLYRDNGDGETDIVADTPVGDVCATDDAGICLATGVGFGDYYWYEVSPPDGFDLPADRTSPIITVNAADSGRLVGPYQFYNPRRPGSAGVAKVDAATGAPLAAATFELHADDGDGAYHAADDPVVGECTTNTTGTCRLEDLDFGTYFWVETVAPPGYQLPATAVSDAIVIDAGNVTTEQQTTVGDDQVLSTLAVHKQDATSGDPLAGAVFQLFRDADGDGAPAGTPDPDDDLVDDCTTDALGSCSLSGLGFGDYYWFEQTAPLGYELPADRTSAITTLDAGNAGGALPATAFADERSPWRVTKSSNPASGTTVKAGDVVTYTLTVRPLAGAAADIAVTDDLSGVLDDADLVAGSIAPEAGTADVSGTTLTWTIDSIESATTLTYQVRVRDGATGPLANAVAGEGASPCLADDPDCDRTTHPVEQPSPPPTTGTPAPTPSATPTNGPEACRSAATTSRCPGSSPTHGGNGGDDGTGSSQSGGLPDTGGPARWLPLVGVGMIAGGGLLLLTRRRWRPSGRRTLGR